MPDIISVVIPVYNERKYLGECIDSILCQSWKDIEIIIVDDGSDADVADMCDVLTEKDSRIRAMHQQNGGSALARENGIKSAKGKWIAFVDSDDMLDDKDALRYMAECGEKSGADIVTGNYRKLTDNGPTAVKEEHFFHMKNHGSVEFRFRGFVQDGHLAYEWGKLYRRDFLIQNEIRHTPYPFTQDRAFNMKCYLACPRYEFVDASVYLYRVNREGVTFSYKKNFREVWIRIGREIDTVMAEKASKMKAGDLVSLHLLLGIYYFGKQEIMQGQKKGRTIRSELRDYMNDPTVRKYTQLYFRERYGKELGSPTWHLFFTALAVVVRRKWNTAAYMMFRILLALQVESRVSTGRYRGHRNEKRQY